MPSRPKKSIFSEQTLIPVSLLTVVGAVIFWVGSLAARVDANAAQISSHGETERATYAEIAQLHSQVAAIDAKLTTILEMMRAELRHEK